MLIGNNNTKFIRIYQKIVCFSNKILIKLLNTKSYIMKKTLMLLILFFTLGTFAQDQIIKKDGSELKVKITEISDTALKYQK